MKALKNVLLINAVSSGATGLALIVVPGLIAKLFSVSGTKPFIGVGLFLVVFASMVFFEGLRNPVSKYWVRFIIILDTLWVAGSLAVILVKAFDLSSLGYLLIGAVALWVALMAYLQFNGLKHIAVVK